MSKKMSPIDRKNWIVLSIVLVLSIALTTFLTFSSLVDLKAIKDLGNDIQFNLISTSATIGGFLFTGISILISAIGNKRIERLWDHNYLNNVYRAATVGISANVATILAALAMLFLVLEEKVQLIIIRIEIITVLVSVIFFIWSVLDLVFVLSSMKNKNTNSTSLRDQILPFPYKQAESVWIMILNLQSPVEGSLSVTTERPGNLHALSI